MYCTEDTLTSKNLGEMLTEVLDWHKLGTKLDLRDHSLAEIRINYSVHGNDRQRQEMITKWLAFDTEASWSKLAGALEKMGENTAAKNIRDKYVPHCRGRLQQLPVVPLIRGGKLFMVVLRNAPLRGHWVEGAMANGYSTHH